MSSADETDGSDGADAVDLTESCAVLVERHGHACLDVGQARVGGAELTNKVLGEFFAGAFRR